MASLALAPTVIRTPTALRESARTRRRNPRRGRRPGRRPPALHPGAHHRTDLRAALLVGGAFGLSRGAVSLLLYLAVGALGAPSVRRWLPRPRRAAFGHRRLLIGMALAAALVGAAADRGWDRRLLGSLTAMFVGSALIYAVGATWLAVSLDVDAATAVDLGVAPFLVGDLVKLALAGLLLPSAWGLVTRVRRDDRH